MREMRHFPGIPSLVFSDIASRRSGAILFRSLVFCCLLILAMAIPIRSAAGEDEALGMMDYLDTADFSDADTPSVVIPEGAQEIQLPVGGITERDLLRVITLTPRGYLDYDDDRGAIYSPERTRVTFRGAELEADSIDFNVRVREVTASGNVILTFEDSVVRADRMRYNFTEHEGLAYQAEGRYDRVYFHHGEDERPDEPTFQRISEQEVLLREAGVTGCDFPIPHYRISAREILLYPNDRIFFRSATLYVRGMPVFYLPFFSKSLREVTPWYVRAGYRSELGAWIRLGYVYRHATQVPSMQAADRLETKSQGKADIFADFLSKKGLGGGLKYEYFFDFQRHQGIAGLYSLDDSDWGDKGYSVDYFDQTRDVEGNRITTPGTERTRTYSGESDQHRYDIFLKHRSHISDDLTWLIDSDWFSDPDLHDQVLDMFRDDDRRRVMERRARTALTLAREQYVARLVMEVKDRIGRDRITNFSDPTDNDRDFDEQPDLPIRDRDATAISTDRWGRATVRAPQLTVETAWIRLWNTPVYYHSDLNIFNNLDKGLNTLDRGDDAWVQGVDWYQALMWRWRIAQRLTAVTQIGAGVGYARRSDDDFGYFGDDRTYPLILSDVEGGLEFIDPDTFLIGTRPFNLERDVSDGFVYGDFLERLHMRFSDALTGDLTYRYRATTDHFLGDWYAEMGNRFVREDLYNFRLREHNLEGVLRYTLARPRLVLSARLFQNLINDSDLYPQEERSSQGIAGQWSNARQTLAIASSAALADRQIGHPSDPRSYIDSSFNTGLSVNYRPLSKLWWTRWSMTYEQSLDRSTGESRFTRFNEEDNYTRIRGLIGGQVGPKWTSELRGEWDSRGGVFKDLRLNLKRDLHDALLIMMVGVKRDVYDDKDSLSQLDFRVGLQPKLPGAEEPVGIPGIQILRDSDKIPALESGSVIF